MVNKPESNEQKKPAVQKGFLLSKPKEKPMKVESKSVKSHLKEHANYKKF